jgi:hypothetical protein
MKHDSKNGGVVSDGSCLTGPERCNVRSGRLSNATLFHVEREPGSTTLELIVLLILLVAIALVIGITPSEVALK